MLDFLFFIPPDDTSASNNRILPWSSFLVICGGWLILWYLTPGLHGNGIGNLFTNNDESSIFLETIIALIIVIILIVTHKRCNQLLFHQSKMDLSLYFSRCSGFGASFLLQSSASSTSLYFLDDCFCILAGLPYIWIIAELLRGTPANVDSYSGSCNHFLYWSCGIYSR